MAALEIHMTQNDVGRRNFLKAAGTGLLILRPETVRGTPANSTVRVGLLGCGGRGTEVATGMVRNAGARITALGDLFEDQLTRAKAHFDTLGTIDSSQLFQGPHAHEKMAASKEVDAIYILFDDEPFERRGVAVRFVLRRRHPHGYVRFVSPRPAVNHGESRAAGCNPACSG